MKKSSNRDAYERRKGKINSTVITTDEVDDKIEESNNEKAIKTVLNDTPIIPSIPSSPPQKIAFEPKREKIQKVDKTVQAVDTSNKKTVRSHNTNHNKKHNQRKVILISGVIVVAVIILFVALYSVFGGKADFHAAFAIDSATAKVGTEVITMDNAVYIEKDTSMLPLKGAAEVLPIKIKWNEKSDDVTVKGNGVKLKFTIGSKTVNVNGKDETWSEEPLVKGKEVYVPLVAFCKALHYDTAYSPSISRIDVFPPNDENKAPTVSFSTNKDVYKVGETVKYTVDAKDSDDVVVEYKWTNYQETFTTSGRITISLSVMDSRGAWSEEVAKTITIKESADDVATD